MNFGRWIAFAVIAASAITTLKAGGGKDVFTGVWLPQKIVVNGKETPKDQLKKVKLTVKKNDYTVHIEGKLVSKGTFSTNAGKKPAQIDITAVSPDGKTKTKVLGIYKLDGKTLTVCGASPKTARPTDFTSKAGSMRELVIYRRQKK